MKKTERKRKYYPSFEEFKEMRKEGNLIPIYTEILADMETPVSAFKKIGKNKYSFLLESVEGGEKWGRYSFIGFDPALIFRSKGRRVELVRDGKTQTIEDSEYPLDVLREIMSRYNLVEVEGLPRFFGGAVGYVNYDMVRFIERLPDHTQDDLNLLDSIFLITETILIFDNLTNTIKIVCNVHVDEGKSLEEVYNNAQNKIDRIISLLRKPSPVTAIEFHGDEPISVSSNMEIEYFKKIVTKAKEYITAGDIIQVVLSQRFQTKLEGDPFNVYRALRRVNPSPYMYYLSFDDLIIAGASPEVLVRVEGDNIELRPIAGTRPRGKNEKEDEWFQEDLLKDPKEIAEHVMLVDLGRNDVGRVSKMGSVEVPEFLVIEKYSHVMHIVSDVRGILEKGMDSFDVLKASFPAGTVSGAPKVRAMEIIEELEKSKRGPYAGAVGYFSFSGNMDFCIVIRTILIKNDTIYFQAGAGIVADSEPENEFQETLNKAKAMVKALQMVKEGLE
ncbi:MAG: anthranilate synthase component I [Deltaproteobacteria bacterium]|nr:anthranilate synthase component I [Deltaproteobacteria bacterium]